MREQFNHLQVLQFLGVTKSARDVISSLMLVMIVIFYLFVFGTTFHFNTLSFQHRVTYQGTFNLNLIERNTDSAILVALTILWFFFATKQGYARLFPIAYFSFMLILQAIGKGPFELAGALTTLPIIILVVILDKVRIISILKYKGVLFVNYLSILAIAIAILGTGSLITFVSSGTSNIFGEHYPYSIFQLLLGNLTPIFMAMLIFCLPIKVVSNILTQNIKIFGNQILLDVVHIGLSSHRRLLYVILFCLLAASVAYLPHFLAVNPNHERLGVDTPRYVKSIKLMENHSNPLIYAFTISGDRPLTLVILFLFSLPSQIDLTTTIEFFPLILSPLLTLAVYFVTREITSNDKISIFAAVLTAFSFQVLAGIYSGFYANWLALIIGYFGQALIFRSLKKPSKFAMILMGISFTGMLLSHVYTWTILISINFVFLFVLLILKCFPRKRILLIYLILSSSIAVDVLKSSLLGGSSGFEADLSIGKQGLGLSQFSDRLKTLADTVQTYYGGVYANIAILGLGLYWLFRCNLREMANLFLFIFLSSALVPLLLGDWVLQSRLLYEIPFQIPAAIALFFLWKGNHKVVFTGLLLIAFYLSLHVIVNLGFVPAVSQLPFSKIIGN